MYKRTNMRVIGNTATYIAQRGALTSDSVRTATVAERARYGESRVQTHKHAGLGNTATYIA